MHEQPHDAAPATRPRTGRSIFIDVDGTLIDHHGHIPDSAKAAVRAASANGHWVFLCTGRSRPELWPEITDLGFDGMVAGAGAFAAVGDTELLHQHLDADQINRLADFFTGQGIAYTFEGAYGLFGTRTFRDQLVSKIAEEYPDPDRLAEMRRGILSFIDRLEDDPRPTRPVSKAMFMFEGGITFDEIREELSDFHIIGSSMPSYGYYSGELQMVGVHKAAGMEAVLNHLGLDPADSVAIGDSDNDVEMMGYAGLGIAMGNATPRIKEIADDITASVTEDGIAKALLRHGLID
ncbi:MAG: HAD family hydrolase [Propioniciclava sp.]|uniref:HAD family hydrolase n=1 Tax=Propioniciclava sp. TaxID=2038686 RepID=UPI0039E6D9D6